MLHGRRVLGSLLFAMALLPLFGEGLFGQSKDKDKSKEAKKSGDKVTLELKFKQGKAFYQKMYTNTVQNMTVMNSQVKQDQKQTFYFSWTPKEKKEDGKWVIVQKILGVEMEIDIGGSPIKYDSTKPAGNNASTSLSEFFKALIGSEFTLTYDPKKQEITAIDGREEFIKKLVQTNRQMETLLKQILSDNALKEMAKPTFAFIAAGEVEKGKEWKNQSTLDMGPIGKYVNKHTYKYEGEDSSKLDKITVKTELTYQAPENVAGAGGLPFKIAKAALTSKNANGTILFNREKGRIEKSESTLQLSGKLDIDIGGQKTQVELSQDQKTEITTYDTNPLETKEPAKK